MESKSCVSGNPRVRPVASSLRANAVSSSNRDIPEVGFMRDENAPGREVVCRSSSAVLARDTSESSSATESSSRVDPLVCVDAGGEGKEDRSVFVASIFLKVERAADIVLRSAASLSSKRLTWSCEEESCFLSSATSSSSSWIRVFFRALYSC